MVTASSERVAHAGAELQSARRELGRQLAHWRLATDRLNDAEAVAAPAAWESLEHYLGVALRHTLSASLHKVRVCASELAARLNAAATAADLDEVRRRILQLRQAYLRAEAIVEFYADVLATRNAPRVGALLRACDHIATRGMAQILTPMGRQVPAVCSYLDGGQGAAIVRAGIRLADGSTETPIATIKVTRHNILRCSAVLHEAGHQVAHMLDFNAELALALREAAGGELGEIWASHSSELAADAIAFVHTGFAAVAALHDVVDGAGGQVFEHVPGDPHPSGHVRTMLGIALCRSAFGAGPWDKLEASWQRHHPIESAPREWRAFIDASMRFLPKAVQALLHRPYKAFGGRPLSRVVDPAAVSPAALAQLAQDAGRAAFSSPYWLWNEAVRLVALTGYRAALGPAELTEAVRQQEQWMLRLGGLRLPT